MLPTGEDFFYRVEGENRWYSYLDSVDDLTSAFEIKVTGSKFVIRCKQKSIQAVLELLYGKAVEIPTEEDKGYHFKLVVASDTSWISERSIEVVFRSSVRVEDIEIDPPNIPF